MENTNAQEESLVAKGAELVRKLQAQGKLYDKEFERWLNECKRIMRRYRSEKGNGLDWEEDGQAWFNLFWASLQTAIPALYARTPLATVERRYKDSDPIARVASEILERAVRFEVGNFDFDSIIRAAILDRLLYGRGIVRVCYEPQIAIVDGVERKVNERVYLDYVQLIDFKHSSARTWEEVTQVRFRSYLSKEEATARFGKEQAKKLKFTHMPEQLEDEKTFGDGEQAEFKKAEVWEVWDKPTRTVFWMSSELKDNVLDMKPDPLQLEGFFPISRPLYGTLTNDTLIPVPDARQCKKLYNLLDDIEAKIGALTQDLRVAGFYDAQLEEITRVVTSGDKLIPVRNYAAVKAQGGLSEAIDFWPLDHVVSALTILYQQKDQTKNDIYEITGWADIMRGMSDPNETAAAQQLKGRFASIRLTNAQNDVQRFCRDAMALMGEIIAEQFEPEFLLAMTGLEFVPGESPEEKQQNFIAAVELLRNEPSRRFRIDIETDSTLAINEALDQQNRSDFLQSLVGALQTMGPLFEQMPAFVPVLGEAINFVARTYRAGRNMEGSIEQAIEQAKAMLVQNQQQPQQPDPKLLEIQSKMQLEQYKTETALQLEQYKAQAVMELEQLKAEHDMQLAAAKAQLEQEQAKVEALQEMEKTRNAIMIEQARLDADIRVQQAQAKSDIAIQSMKAELDSAIKTQRKVVEAYDPIPEIKRPKKRKVVLHLDEQGNRSYIIEDVEEPQEAGEQPEGTALDLTEDVAEGEPVVRA